MITGSPRHDPRGFIMKEEGVMGDDDDDNNDDAAIVSSTSTSTSTSNNNININNNNRAPAPTTATTTRDEENPNRRASLVRSSSSSSSSNNVARRRDDAPPAAVTPPTAAPHHHNNYNNNNKGEEDTLREQLQKLVSHKLTTLGGELDHAGMVALEALSKLPPATGVAHSAAAGGGAGGAGPGADRGAKRILPPGLEKIKKFSGKDPHGVTDTLNQFHSLVVAALPGVNARGINKALNRDVVFVLEGAALKFFNSLKAGEIEWEPIPRVPPEEETESKQEGEEGVQQHQQQQQQQQQSPPPQEGPGREKKLVRPPSTWAELYEAFHDYYLPVAGIARTTEKLFALSQASGESVRDLAQRQLGLGQHINRLIDGNGGQTTFWEAITVRLFERALRTDLRRLQDAEPPCSTFEESVERAARNDKNLLEKKGDGGGLGRDGKKRGDDSSSGGVADVAEGNGASSEVKDPIAVPTARDGVAASEGGGVGGVGGGDGAAVPAPPHGPVLSGVLPKRVIKESSDQDSGRNGRGERSRSIAPGHRETTAQKKGGDSNNRGDFSATTLLNDAGQGAGDTSSDDRRARGASRRRDEPGGGGETRRGNSGGGFTEDRGRSMPANRNKGSRKGKRGRDWQENHNGGAGQHFPPRPFPPRPFPPRPFPPPQRPRHIDPADTPPCTIPQCKTINRQFHSSNECFYHPVHGQRNSERRGQKHRPPPIRQHPVPDPVHQHNNFVGWGPPDHGEIGDDGDY